MQLIVTIFTTLCAVASAARGGRLPMRVHVERCFAYPAAEDPNFFHCLQDLVCNGAILPNVTSTGTSNSSVSAASTPTVTVPNPCDPNGSCDCSLIQDKNGDDYFQCVTNPACERCHTSSTTTTPATTSGLQTFAPGTYTVLVNGTTTVMVLPTQQTVTLTKTTMVTPKLTPPATVTSDTTSSDTSYEATATPSCADCDCSRIADKQSERYYQCLTSLQCEAACRGEKKRLSFFRRM